MPQANRATKAHPDRRLPVPAPKLCRECNGFGVILLEVYEPKTGRIVAVGSRPCPACKGREK